MLTSVSVLFQDGVQSRWELIISALETECKSSLDIRVGFKDVNLCSSCECFL